MIKDYQFGTTDAFVTGPDNIDSYYFNLTHGRPRQHIWTFVSALNETTNFSTFKCNINTANRTTHVLSIHGE